MTDTATDLAPVAILGSGLCIPDGDVASDLGLVSAELDASILPPMVRRRTSMATRAAVTAAGRACAAADSGHKLPAIFVSSAGEMQVTDKLCHAISQQEYPLSPTLFHNSVHNTAAGYWSMATGSMASMQAMGAQDDGFALGLLEAWCQLQTIAERLLLVVYDEVMPEQLLPDYAWKACAFALVLDRDTRGHPLMQRPVQTAVPNTDSPVTDFPAQNPAMAALPLFRTLQQANSGQHQIALSPGAQPWLTDLVMP